MKKLLNYLTAGFISSFPAIVSCNNSQIRTHQERHKHEQHAPFDENTPIPDRLPLDSVTTDSVDHNQPESPRM